MECDCGSSSGGAGCTRATLTDEGEQGSHVAEVKAMGSQVFYGGHSGPLPVCSLSSLTQVTINEENKMSSLESCPRALPWAGTGNMHKQLSPPSADGKSDPELAVHVTHQKSFPTTTPSYPMKRVTAIPFHINHEHFHHSWLSI